MAGKITQFQFPARQSMVLATGHNYHTRAHFGYLAETGIPVTVLETESFVTGEVKQVLLSGDEVGQFIKAWHAFVSQGGVSEMAADEAPALMQARIDALNAQHDADQQQIAALRVFAEALANVPADMARIMSMQNGVSGLGCGWCGAITSPHADWCIISRAHAWLAAHPASGATTPPEA